MIICAKPDAWDYYVVSKFSNLTNDFTKRTTVLGKKRKLRCL